MGNGREPFFSNEKHLTRTCVIHISRPDLVKPGKQNIHSFKQEASFKMDEASNLANAIDIELVHTEIISLKKITASHLMGKGNYQRLADLGKEEEIELFIINHPLSPIQQRNLEKELKAKVIDRTALILEIFGDRAKTKEGRLQVELAALSYQKSRLVRSWTHLERQRGGFGFTGGPGETQIEIDRRLISERMTRLKKELEKVKTVRGVNRKKRQSVPFPVVALVGYTNAGKSTLFNYLTGSDVFAKDMLFATLDPTMRQLKTEKSGNIILSDTVGFISDLPTELVASFRATLEEVLEADCLLHVIDVSDPFYENHRENVYKVLEQIGIDIDDHNKIIEVYNKVDMLEEDDHTEAKRAIDKRSEDTKFQTHIISVHEEISIPEVLQTIDQKLSLSKEQKTYHFGFEYGNFLSWFRKHMVILEQRSDETGYILDTIASPEKHIHAESMMADIRNKNKTGD